jgi:hypothetical protein
VNHCALRQVIGMVCESSLIVALFIGIRYDS